MPVLWKTLDPSRSFRWILGDVLAPFFWAQGRYLLNLGKEESGGALKTCWFDNSLWALWDSRVPAIPKKEKHTNITFSFSESLWGCPKRLFLEKRESMVQLWQKKRVTYCSVHSLDYKLTTACFAGWSVHHLPIPFEWRIGCNWFGYDTKTCTPIPTMGDNSALDDGIQPKSTVSRGRIGGHSFVWHPAVRSSNDNWQIFW